jgi:ubiquinone/menaquinone biosynthesis C-methylase UbiE
MSVSGWLFACIYDRMTASVEAAGLRTRRERLLGSASGRVLEIGAGTGANLPFYGAGVEAITVAEPEAPMARKLARRLREQRRGIALVQAPAEQLPFRDAQFDTVVSTLVLCTVRDLAQALSEVGRVLKPAGRLLFIEHVRSDEPRLAAWQDRLNGLNRIVAHGCNCNRSTLDAIRAAGFTVTSLEQGNLAKAPPFVRPLIVGTAEAHTAR